MSEEKSKRFPISLSISIYKDLEKLAETKGHSPITYSNFIVKKEVERARAEGEVPTDENVLDRLKLFFKSVSAGNYYSEADIAKLSGSLDIPVEHLAEHQECFQKRGEKVGK